MNEIIKIASVVFILIALALGVAHICNWAVNDTAEYRKAKKIEAAYEKAGEDAVIRRIDGKYVVEHSGGD